MHECFDVSCSLAVFYASDDSVLGNEINLSVISHRMHKVDLLVVDRLLNKLPDFNYKSVSSTLRNVHLDL